MKKNDWRVKCRRLSRVLDRKLCIRLAKNTTWVRTTEAQISTRITSICPSLAGGPVGVVGAGVAGLSDRISIRLPWQAPSKPNRADMLAHQCRSDRHTRKAA